MTPRGFWSYARGDDEHLDRRLSELRGRVAGEISTLLGRDIDMFQDVYDIRTGDDWQEKLRAEITGASFMVPVLTPRYFERPWCREELMAFIRLSEEAGRPALLFPIYFVRDRRFDRGEHCEVRAAVARRQYHDFRELRFVSDTSRIERAIHEFANDVVDALEKAGDAAPTPAPPPKPKAPPPPKPKAPPPREVARPGTPPAESVEPLPQRNAVGTLVVDQIGAGDFRTIGEAIKAAAAGSRIVVRPGRYEENLWVRKPLEIVGDGPREEIVVAPASGTALRLDAETARIERLTLHSPDGFALAVMAGRAEIVDCAISRPKGRSAAVGVWRPYNARGPAPAPTFLRCRFAGAEIGINVSDGATATLEACELLDNEVGLCVLDGAQVRVLRCRFSGNRGSAIDIADAESGGEFIGNDLRGNPGRNWSIADGAERNVLRRDNIED